MIRFQWSPKLRRVILLLFAAGMGIAATVLVRQYLGRRTAELEQERQRLLAEYQAPIEVVVASRDLPQGTTIEARDLTTVMVPEKFVQPYSLRAAQQQRALGLITVAPIAEGEQILSNKVRRPEAVPKGAILSDITPKGRRAVTILVDPITGVGGFVRPGDTVDLVFTTKVPASAGQPEQVLTLTLFQDVPVLAVGADMQQGGGPTSAQAAAQSQYTVTLALNPQEISFLLFAREQGRIQLSLRPSGERDGEVPVIPASVATFSQFMESRLATTQPPEPPPPPTPQKIERQVEVYKGLKRDVVVLSEEFPLAPAE